MKKSNFSYSLAFFVLLIDLADATNTNTTRNVMDTFAPDILIDSRVNTNIFSAHSLLSELANAIEATRSSSLESTI